MLKFDNVKIFYRSVLVQSFAKMFMESLDLCSSIVPQYIFNNGFS